jgi:hypothetical protein
MYRISEQESTFGDQESSWNVLVSDGHRGDGVRWIGKWLILLTSGKSELFRGWAFVRGNVPVYSCAAAASEPILGHQRKTG